jgi:hypothetical protein
MSDDLGEVWCKALHRHFVNRYAVWPLGEDIKLGDFGVMVDEGPWPWSNGTLFSRSSNLTDHFGIKFNERKGKPNEFMEFTSAEGVSAKFTAKGAMKPNGATAIKASLDISFSSKNVVYFASAGCQMNSIDDQVALGEEIRKLMKAGRWDHHWVVVTEITNAEKTTALISLSSDASMSLEASGNVDVIKLADASLTLNYTSYSNTALNVVASPGFQPLIGLSKMLSLASDTPMGPYFVGSAKVQKDAMHDSLHKDIYFGRI